MASLFGQYLREQADWRDQKAQEFPDDVRNVKAAETLRAWADWYDDVDGRAPAKSALEADPFNLDYYEPSIESEQFIKDAPYRDWIRDFGDATLWVLEKDRASRTTLGNYRKAAQVEVSGLADKLAELVTVLENLDYDEISSYGDSDDSTIVDLQDLPDLGDIIEVGLSDTGVDEYIDGLAFRNRIVATVAFRVREQVAA